MGMNAFKAMMEFHRIILAYRQACKDAREDPRPLDCPFCGAHAQVIGSEYICKWTVECPGCGASIKPMCATRNEAVYRWNDIAENEAKKKGENK